MAITKQQKEAILYLAGRELSGEVERVLFGRQPCLCTHFTLDDDGHCMACKGTPAAQWAESDIACKFLRGHVRNWSAWLRDRFLDHLGQVISWRVAQAQGGSGAIQPRLWVLYAMPEDICRAAILAKMEEGKG